MLRLATMQTQFIMWVYSIMVALRMQTGEAQAPWAESYIDTASAIAARCTDHSVPGGGRDWCAAVAVYMSWHESRYNPDATHDNGAGLGLFGTHAGTLGRPVPKDSEGQVDAFLELLGTSFRICAKQPIDERLGWYMAGGDGCERRLDLSTFRMHGAARLLRAHPAPVFAPTADTMAGNP